MKLQDAKRDYYRKMAKEKGYKSRAAFKLVDTNRRYHLIQRGECVIDFGAAPGGWVQVSSELVGDKGIVIAVDIVPIKLSMSNVRLLQSDVREFTLLDKLLELVPGKADVVLSDIAPQVSGAWDLDHYKQVELTLAVIQLARSLLRRGGNAMFKVFDGERSQEVTKTLKEMFEFVAITKPKASRMKSSELYLVCLRSR